MLIWNSAICKKVIDINQIFVAWMNQYYVESQVFKNNPYSISELKDVSLVISDIEPQLW